MKLMQKIDKKIASVDHKIEIVSPLKIDLISQIFLCNFNDIKSVVRVDFDLPNWTRATCWSGLACRTQPGLPRQHTMLRKSDRSLVRHIRVATFRSLLGIWLGERRGHRSAQQPITHSAQATSNASNNQVHAAISAL